jgi:fibronectin-binding autotransporter adhesin
MRGTDEAARRWQRRIAAALCAIAIPLTLASAAPANTYTPTRTDDPVPTACKPSDCSLREAIIRANHHPGTDRIVLGGGRTYELARPANLEDDETNGDLNLTDSVKLVSSSRKLATIDANGIDDGIHSGAPGVKAVIRHLRVRGGIGAIELVGGTLSISSSEISRNISTVPGGGVDTIAGTLLKVSKSTISDNHTTAGGGGLAVYGKATVADSTIAGNTADGQGGGIFDAGTVNLNAVTVAYNRSDVEGFGGGDGGGLWVDPAAIAFNVKNSLVARNTAGASSGPDCASSINQFLSGGHNLIGTTSGCTGFGPPAQGDILNPPSSKIRIGQLDDNGGATKTIALRRGSKAIDHGGPSTPPRDQRGVKRDAHPDIGAFERR